MTTGLGTPSGAVATRTGGAVQVLVLEGDADQRELLGIHLRRAGCVVHAAGRFDDAVDVLEHLDLDLAVLDVDLPGGAGDAVAALIRGRRPTCTVVLSSVLDREAFPIATRVLAKPFSRDEVLGLVPRPVGSFLPRPRSGADR